MSVTRVGQDQLVQRAESLVRDLKASRWNKDVGNTQASRALEVARDASTVRLFVNWLRYQAARESERQPFGSVQMGHGGRKISLAEAITRELNALQQEAGGDPMEAVRLFMGYFRWNPWRGIETRSPSTSWMTSSVPSVRMSGIPAEG